MIVYKNDMCNISIRDLAPEIIVKSPTHVSIKFNREGVLVEVERGDDAYSVSVDGDINTIDSLPEDSKITIPDLIVDVCGGFTQYIYQDVVIITGKGIDFEMSIFIIDGIINLSADNTNGGNIDNMLKTKKLQSEIKPAYPRMLLKDAPVAKRCISSVIDSVDDHIEAIAAMLYPDLVSDPLDGYETEEMAEVILILADLLYGNNTHAEVEEMLNEKGLTMYKEDKKETK